MYIVKNETFSNDDYLPTVVESQYNQRVSNYIIAVPIKSNWHSLSIEQFLEIRSSIISYYCTML